MNTVTSLFVIITSLGYQATSDRVKYDISWNPKITEKLSPGRIFHHDVTIGEYMDVICPQYDVDESKDEMMTFLVYNVTKEVFHSCSKITNETAKILSCTHPTRNTKLTIKFQSFSPNPKGFIYKPNSYYYLMSYLNDESARNSEPNCENKMRMKLFVHPGKHQRHRDTSTTRSFVVTKNSVQNEQTSSHIANKNKETPVPLNSSSKLKPSIFLAFFCCFKFFIFFVKLV